jgi:hypothetical protein
VPNKDPVIPADTFKLPVIVCVPIILRLEETNKLPVIIADPENGNPAPEPPLPPFKAYDAVSD